MWDWMEQDLDQHMTEVSPSKKAAQGQVGAPPIRWGWWAAGIAFSAAMWAGIALAFDWFA